MVELLDHGVAGPRYAYPQLAAGVTAEYWNTSARLNNRVEAELLASDSGP